MTTPAPPPNVLATMHPFNHKTVFLLDHTPYFRTSCESIVEFDLSKIRGTGFIPLAPIHKSLWTCCVESATEYCRIVWDLFPNGKLVSLRVYVSLFKISALFLLSYYTVFFRYVL